MRLPRLPEVRDARAAEHEERERPANALTMALVCPHGCRPDERCESCDG